MLARRALLLLALAAAVAGCLDGAPSAFAPSSLPSPSPSVLPSPSRSPSPPEEQVSGHLRVHYVDVGQGDGVIWQLADGSVAVYDCGPRVAAGVASPMVAHLERIGLAKGAHVAALLLSHGHADHVGGCDPIFDEYVVDHVYDLWYEGSDKPETYDGLQDEALAEGSVLHTARATPTTERELVFAAGDLIALPDAAGASAEILWPRAPWSVKSWDAIAEASLVVRLTFGAISFCFQGDIELAQERKLAADPRDLACDVYLIGHHGSRYASDASWLAKMDPEFAVVSFGENGFGHPTSDALCRVQQAGARVWATHRGGSVVVETDGANVTVTTAAEEGADYCAEGATYWGT